MIPVCACHEAPPSGVCHGARVGAVLGDGEDSGACGDEVADVQ